MGLFGFLLGTVLGSLVKALADRSLTKKTFWGRSYCPHCKKVLRWYDLLPILSYLLLKGRCRYCGDKIGLEYLVVELVMGILVGYLFYQTFWNFQPFDSLRSLRAGFQFSVFISDLIYKIFFITILAILFLTDIKKMFIPDRITFPAIKITVIYLVLLTIYKIGYLYYYLSQSTLGRLLLPPHTNYFQRHALIIAQPFLISILMGILVGGFFLSLIIITKGKGMGGGDVKLGALMGLGLGFPNSLLALMLAFLTGAAYSILALLSQRKQFGQSIPFGPFLVLGSIISIFWGNQIIDWYLRLTI